MSEPSPKSHEVFISYSSKDKTWADAVCAVLERHRVRCWIAPRDIVPGTEWGAAIIGGIDACKIMVLIFSGHANESAQVRREVERAISKGMSVLPLRVEDIRPEGAMEYALSNTHWLDAFTPPVERQMETLAAAVEVLLRRGRPEGEVSTSGGGPAVAMPDPTAAPGGSGRGPFGSPTGRGHGRWLAAAAVLLLLAGLAAVGTMLKRVDGLGKEGGIGPVPAKSAADPVVGTPAPAARQVTPSAPAASPTSATAQAGRPATGPAEQVVSSEFTEGTRDGWSVRDNDGSVEDSLQFWVERKPKNSWLIAHSKPNGKVWGWVAPPKFLGDQSDKFGRLLRFSIFTNAIQGGDMLAERVVRLRGGKKGLYVDAATLGAPLPNKWKVYGIPLDVRGGWKIATANRQNIRATNEDIKQVLAGLTEIWIKGEYSPNSTGRLDYVQFGAAP